MAQSLTPLSVAFIWHMHQPDYKDQLTGEYLMPWVRLHAIKDYLDMVLILEPYPRIRQTFNLVPALMDQLADYCRPETRDLHMTITLKEGLTEEDKRFIFQRFFDASPETMISKSPYYFALYERRNQLWAEGEPPIDAFTEEEYHDITALFNLVWFDPLWFEQKPALQRLWEKQKGYSLSDRTRILEIQREIINEILPVYKRFQENGQIEVTTTPYYHPILPLLIDTNSARVAMPGAILPEEPFQHPEDAWHQVDTARSRYQAIFKTEPVGVWPAEQSISPEAIKLFKQAGFQWAVSSEGNLSNSIGITLDKDPFGNVVNADVLCQPYQYEGVNLLFRHLTLSDLIGFQYANMSPEAAVQDFMHRLKQIQQRCTAMGVQYPIVTIALDGENCWEFYQNDGHTFLSQLYQALSEDTSLNVCRVQDYFAQVPSQAIRPLSYLHSGSWINSNFHIWIADPVKNAAWTYLSRTRQDLAHLTDSGHYQPETLKQAWEEIYIAEGSDWFWWYGEPHNSGQDEVFDMQFRRHLANVYRLLSLDIPNFLEIPLTLTMGRPVVPAVGPISPQITGRMETHHEWEHAGSFDLSHGAMHRSSRILNRIQFGSDHQYAYLRFELNLESLSPFHEIVLYCCTPGKTRHNSPVRLICPSGKTVLTERYHYAYEIQLKQLAPGQVEASGAEALPDYLWYKRTDLVKSVAFEDVLDVALDLDKMNTCAEEYLQFTVALVQGGVIEEFQPENYMVSLQRQSAKNIMGEALGQKSLAV